ncbi:zinc finger CCCH domain-containing protein 2-like [Senna tora]|nr:zinc finger CCCH domain-containing protein 2-like [Senna tora]
MISDFDNIPPRKLLTRRAAAADVYCDSPRFSSSDEILLRKFLPHNGDSDDDDGGDSDPYTSDHFRMYEFKVRRCTRSRSHDWTDCPFAHPGEKARRRDPRRYHYSGTVCPEYRRGGGCSRGDACEFAHGVFECWLHPARYRTEACKDGKNCKRKVCFFAHTSRQLRILPVNSPISSPDQISSKNNKFSNNCCLCCHCSASANSPTSTLFGMSHFSPPLSPSSSSVSPPLSPIKRRSLANGMSPISRYSDRFGGSETYNNHGVSMSCKDVLTELMSSFQRLNFSEASSSSSPAISATTINKPLNLPWLDVSNFHCDDQFILSPSAAFNPEDQQQFILSPSSLISQTPTTSSASASFSNGKISSRKIFSDESKISNDNNGSSCAFPDLGWVNDLLM